MTSHAGYSDRLGSMATKILYMTADRQRKNLELRGQIDKLRKNMVLEVRYIYIYINYTDHNYYHNDINIYNNKLDACLVACFSIAQ